MKKSALVERRRGEVIMDETTTTSTVEDHVQTIISELGFDTITLMHEAIGQEMLDVEDTAAADIVRPADATILGRKFDDDENCTSWKDIELGHIHGHLMLFGHALNTGESVLDHAEMGDGDLESAAGLLAKIHEEDPSFEHTGLLIQEVFLKPEYRKRGLGKSILRRYIDWHSAHVFAAVTYPNARHFFDRNTSHPTTKPDDPLFDADGEEGQKKLVAWCKSLGFRQHKNDPKYYVLILEQWDALWRNRRFKATNKPARRSNGIVMNDRERER